MSEEQLKITEKNLQRIKAVHQLIGFKHAQQGYSLKSLISEMGLTKSEWVEMKEHKEVSFLKEEDIFNIDCFLT